MTFPFQPHRTSSEDDALDQQLNDLVSGSETELDNDLAADALEFHRWADETRRSDPAAQGPAARTFNRVLRNSAQESPNRSSAMSSATLSAQSPGFSQVPTESFRERSGRYATLAATVALVLAVAFGGWLAMSQMPGGDGNGRFAAIQGSPEVADATCDVEPMTVDEAMEIVKNPYRSLTLQDSVSTLDVLEIRDHNSRDLVEEGNFLFDEKLIEGEHSVPDAESLVAASTTMNEFLGCLQLGKVGHILRFYDPREVQRIVLAEYPVFRDEDQIRVGVTEFLDYPAQAFAAPSATALQNDSLVYQTNPFRESAAAISYSSTEANLYNASQILLIGTQVTNSHGDVLFQNDADGRSDPIGPLKTTDRIRIVMAESSLTGKWIVLGIIPE